jgi:hypothetical protein
MASDEVLREAAVPLHCLCGRVQTSVMGFAANGTPLCDSWFYRAELAALKGENSLRHSEADYVALAETHDALRERIDATVRELREIVEAFKRSGPSYAGTHGRLRDLADTLQGD